MVHFLYDTLHINKGKITMKNTVYDFFEWVAKKRRDAPAIIENNRTMTFGELSDFVDSIAGAFPEELHSVGVVMSHCAEMVAAILAVLKCGAMYVPAEPTFPVGRIRYMMNEANVNFILTEKQFEEKLDGFALKLFDRHIRGLEKPKSIRKSTVRENSPAYILYTSGTTGTPKGVCVTNGNVCHYVRAFANEFHPKSGDIMLQYSVCSFDIFVEEVFASLLNGAALAIPSSDDKADVHTLMNFIERHNVTILSGFPYLLAEMNRLPEIPPSLRLLISGGDILRGSYIGNLLDKVDVYNTYGPSETTVATTYYHCNGGEVLADGTYPIGKPILGTEIHILDKDGNELPRGETGEICIYGGGVSLGYIGDHAEENKAFETTAGGGRFYRSGDLGYVLPDGNIAFLHRKDDQIMIYGKRVEVAEVESRLYQCKGVEQAIVRALTDENGLFYMTAYIVPSDGQIEVSRIRKELAENLTEFMIPEFFVKMQSIPLNANGKPDKTKLPVVMKEGALL